MSGFGLAHIKKQGAALHPDDVECDMSDARYIQQAAKYIVDTGDNDCAFVRDRLASDISAKAEELRGAK